MKKILLLAFAILFCGIATAQEDNSTLRLKEAYEEMAPVLQEWSEACAASAGHTECLSIADIAGNDPYRQYIAGQILYKTYPQASYNLQKQAHSQLPEVQILSMAYAKQLHRRGEYEKAIPLYEKLLAANPEYQTINVYLSECYLNTGDYEKAVTYWEAADHAANHTGIDFAINEVYADTTQFRKRKDNLTMVKEGNMRAAYSLLYNDLNWQYDWYNADINAELYHTDLALVKEVFGPDAQVIKDVKAYRTSKKAGSAIMPDTDSLTWTLIENKLILNGGRLLPYGHMTSYILNVAFPSGALDPEDFFMERGPELLALAKEYNDVEFLNIYAYLEAVTNGKTSEETDKAGWKEYGDERFAVSYFMGLGEANRYENPDLAAAITQFPHSSSLQWVKLNCAKAEGRDVTPDLISFLQKEFKTLKHDRYRYSRTLNQYMSVLKTSL